MSVENDVARLQADVARLQPGVPRFGRQDFARATQSMMLQELIVFANLIAPGSTAARTDPGADFELHFYTSGIDIVMQVYSTDLAAWKEVTLS